MIAAFRFFLLALFAVYCCDASGSCESPDADVIIVGAGMSGIAAASTFYNSGLTNFLILEARSEIGGRMRSVEFAGIQIELGANWIQGVDPSGSPRERVNPIWELKQRCGLEGQLSDFDSRIVYGENGVDLTSALRDDDLDAAYERVEQLSKSQQAAGLPDISTRAALNMSNWISSSPGDNFIDWFAFDFCFAEPPKVSSLHQSRPLATYDEFGDEDFFVTDQRGYAHLAHCLAEDFINQDSSRLRLNTTVSRVEYNDTCVCAVTKDQTKFCGNYGIVTFPIGVLLNGIGVTFVPPLSQVKANAIRNFSSALYLKIFVEFNETFWDDVEIIGRATNDREDYPVFEPLGKFFPNSTILLVTLTGETAYRVAAQNRSVTRQEILGALRFMYPDFQAELLNMYIPDWASNPLSLGSYSNTKIGVNDQTFKDLVAPLGRLYISGEVTSQKYGGFLHGAYFSGVDAANIILQDMQSTPDSAKVATASVIVISSSLFLLSFLLHCM